MQSIVYNKDCMEVMKGYQDKYFDLAVVDPPYGIGAGNDVARHKFKDNKKGWDDSIPDDEYFYQLFRISKHQIIWGGNYFKLNPTKCLLIWDKKQPENISLAMAEIAWTSFKKPTQIFRYSNKTDRNKIHPTQKPTKLYDWTFKNYLPEGGKVIDTHLGSGSSRISADRCGNIDFVGCEIDVEYYMNQEKRFSNYKLQPELW